MLCKVAPAELCMGKHVRWHVWKDTSANLNLPHLVKPGVFRDCFLQPCFACIVVLCMMLIYVALLHSGLWMYQGWCSPVSCGTVYHPSAPWVMIELCSSLYGEICNLACSPGAEGTPAAACTVDGEWDYTGACTLTPISCGSVDHPDRNAVALPARCSTIFQQSCLLSCSDGYSGNPSAVCLENGVWSYTGACSPTSCGIVQHPSGQHLQVGVLVLSGAFASTPSHSFSSIFDHLP